MPDAPLIGPQPSGWDVDTTEAEAHAIYTLRNWQRAQTDLDYRAQLAAWDDLKVYFSEYGNDNGAKLAADWELTGEEVAAIGTLLQWKQRQAQAYRERYREQQEKEAAANV